MALARRPTDDPFARRLDPGKLVCVLVGDEPECAFDALVRQDRGQPGIEIADEARQHPDARSCRDELVLGIDARRAQGQGKVGINLVEVAQFRRVDQVRDVADEMVAGDQIARFARHRVASQVVFAGIEAKRVIAELAGDHRAALRARQHDRHVGLALGQAEKAGSRNEVDDKVWMGRDEFGNVGGKKPAAEAFADAEQQDACQAIACAGAVRLVHHRGRLGHGLDERQQPLARLGQHLPGIALFEQGGPRSASSLLSRLLTVVPSTQSAAPALASRLVRESARKT